MVEKWNVFTSWNIKIDMMHIQKLKWDPHHVLYQDHEWVYGISNDVVLCQKRVTWVLAWPHIFLDVQATALKCWTNLRCWQLQPVIS